MLRALRSLRAKLLAGLLVPILLFVVVDTISLYRSALGSAHKAYDRRLIAAAHSIGDMLRLEHGALQVIVPYAVLELSRTEEGTAMTYRVSGLDGEFLWGDAAMPRYTGGIPKGAPPGLVIVLEETVREQPVRMAVLYQPVDGHERTGLVTIQVAEPMENRRQMARDILVRTLSLQSILVLGVVLVTYWVVRKALAPLDVLRRQLDKRDGGDLSALKDADAPSELQPVIQALNHLMERLRRLLGQQQRFVADAAHQLRTPLSVLNTLLQSGLRGDVAPPALMMEMQGTVLRATALSNQMLSLAKVEQLGERGEAMVSDVHQAAREAALELSPLVSEKNLDFELTTELSAGEPKIAAHPWLIGELIRNLVYNAIRHTPVGGALGVHIFTDKLSVWFTCWDTGPGIPAEMRERVFEPFASSATLTTRTNGTGLGLAICKAVVVSLQGQIELGSHRPEGDWPGLNVTVRIPRAQER